MRFPLTIRPLLLVAIFPGFLALKATATTYYVDVNSATPTPPYTSWAKASKDIQSAINISTNGDLILVTNGIYNTGGQIAPSDILTNRVAVTRAVTVQSVNGPAQTMIEGYRASATTFSTNDERCVYLTTNATLIGFTLTNGATFPPFTPANLPQCNGGGVYCAANSSVVSNCVIVGNVGGNEAGGAIGGTLLNCAVLDNHCDFGGGVVNSTLINSLVASNSATYGAGVYTSTLTNCLVIDNLATNTGAAGGGAFGSLLNNCTLTGNSSFTGGGACNGTLNNCIIYNNNGGNYAVAYTSISLNNCCTYPLPTSGLGNITNDPAFMNPATGNYQLQSTSPCINSGNNAYASAITDLNGNPRIVGGTVDMGAYEYQTPTSVISYAWLQQYKLPTDGSVDHADLDGTPFTVYQDWIAGLNPKDPTSVLKMLSPTVTNNVSGVTVSWESVSGINYNLLRATNLTSPSTTIQRNIVGQAGMTSYTDATATNGGPYFYRVVVP